MNGEGDDVGPAGVLALRAPLHPRQSPRDVVNLLLLARQGEIAEEVGGEPERSDLAVELAEERGVVAVEGEVRNIDREQLPVEGEVAAVVGDAVEDRVVQEWHPLMEAGAADDVVRGDGFASRQGHLAGGQSSDLALALDRQLTALDLVEESVGGEAHRASGDRLQ